MSASGPPLCRVCLKEHWSREPHILPANAPAEKRSTRNQPRALGIAHTESKSEGAWRRGKQQTPGGSVDRSKVPDDTAKAPKTKSPPGASLATITAATAARGRVNRASMGKNVARHVRAKSAKPSPGKRKPRTKIIATYTPPATAKERGSKKCAQS